MMWTALAIRLFAVITVTIPVTFQAVKLERRVRSARSLPAQAVFPVMPALLTRWAVLPSTPASSAVTHRGFVRKLAAPQYETLVGESWQVRAYHQSQAAKGVVHRYFRRAALACRRADWVV